MIEYGFEFEEWKPIIGFEGLYEVSNYGRIRSLGNRTHKGIHFIAKKKKKKGYMKVSVYKCNKRSTLRVHDEVAKAFIPNRWKLSFVNHRDEDKTNNCVWNLEWCTHQYNQDYGTRKQRISKTLSKPIRCVETGVIYPSASELKKLYGYNESLISAVCNGKRKHKTAYGYHWEFVD